MCNLNPDTVSCIAKKVIKMAKNGVYKQDIMTSGLGTQAELKAAIREAKLNGMYSVADMGRSYRGTYYQIG